MNSNYRKIISGVSVETIITILFAVLMFSFGFYGIGFITCIFVILQIVFIVMMFKKSKEQEKDLNN